MVFHHGEHGGHGEKESADDADRGRISERVRSSSVLTEPNLQSTNLLLRLFAAITGRISPQRGTKSAKRRTTTGQGGVLLLSPQRTKDNGPRTNNKRLRPTIRFWAPGSPAFTKLRINTYLAGPSPQTIAESDFTKGCYL